MRQICFCLLVVLWTALLLPVGLLGGVAAQVTSSETPAPTTEISNPQLVSDIQTATPNPDGSVKHMVSPGETLIGIADAYGIQLADLLSQNGLNQDSVIFPQQELLIQTASPPTATIEPSPTSTDVPPTPTRRSTRTSAPTTEKLSPTVTAQVLAKIGEDQEGAAQTGLGETSQVGQELPNLDRGDIDLVGNALLIVIAVLVAVGALFIIVGSLLRRKS